MTTPIQSGPSSTGDIHYSAVFPIIETKCGLTRAPASPDWYVVTCVACLTLGAKHSEAARTSLARRQSEAERVATDAERVP